VDASREAIELMMATIDRCTLKFSEAVKENFGFLEDHGLNLVRCTATFVHYESSRIYVNVYHGRKSFEIGIEIGEIRTKIPEESSFSISEIIRLLERGKIDQYRNFAARSAASVMKGVQQLAELFCSYVEMGLLEQVGLFVRLRKQRERWSQSFARSVDLTHAREKLASAWRVKDYAGIVGLLRPLRDTLSPSEQKKLEFAETQIKS
jgi:hypothetical protein